MRLQLASFALIISFLLLTASANAQWDSVGNQGFSSGVVNYTSIAVNRSGTPYVAFIDGNVSYKATVMSYNGSS
ncbi:MAG: hypothetical protein ACTHJ0_01680, partial [Flavipsychrobacter sp.]